MARLLVGRSVVLSTADVREACTVGTTWVHALHFDLNTVFMHVCVCACTCVYAQIYQMWLSMLDNILP